MYTKLREITLHFINCYQIRSPEECTRHLHILGRGRGPNMYSGVLEPIPLYLVFGLGTVADYRGDSLEGAGKVAGASWEEVKGGTEIR